MKLLDALENIYMAFKTQFMMLLHNLHVNPAKLLKNWNTL